MKRIKADRPVQLSSDGLAEIDRARARGAAQDQRRRMSLEHLALCHVAATGHGPAALGARAEVSREDLESVIIGPAFVDTLILSRPFLDLYEEEAHVGPRRPSSPVESGARAYHVEAAYRYDLPKGSI